MKIHPAIGLLGVFAVLGAFGCASTNAWKRFYTPPTGLTVTFSERDSVQVRVVNMSQFAEGAAAAQRYLDDRKLAPEDVSAEDSRACRQMMLDALRIRNRAEEIAFVGVSSFTSPTPPDSGDPALIAFAKSIGADMVVLGWEYVGEKTGYQSVPVVSSSYGSATATATGGGGWATGYASGYSNTVTMVPVQTTFQQWSIGAIYYRFVSGDERAKLDAILNSNSRETSR